MKSQQYEQIVGRIVKSIFEHAEGVAVEEVGHGRKNRLPGASGYRHQVDVSVQRAPDVLLVECKCWEKKVSTESVLTFAARVCDIRRSLPKETKVHAAVVTTEGLQRGAETLAKYFGIGLYNVRSPDEFVFKYKQAITAGVADRFVFSDEAKAVVRPAGAPLKKDE